MPKTKTTREEHATILAALRYYGDIGFGEPANRPEHIQDIATDCGAVTSLDAAGITALADRLNKPKKVKAPKGKAKKIKVRNKRLRIYDNGGNTTDRYTVYYVSKSPDADGRYPYVGMSADPTSPLGFCQHDAANELPDDETTSLGERIKFRDLPKACRNVVRQEYAEMIA